MINWIRQLLASEQPILEKYTIVDPSAVGERVRSVTLALTPNTDDSPTSVVSLYWTEADAKIYEKQFEDLQAAHTIFDSIKQDLSEAATLTKVDKLSEAGALVSTLFTRYETHTDTLVDGNPPPITTTMAALDESQNPLISETEANQTLVGTPEWVESTLSNLQNDYVTAKFIPDSHDIVYDLQSIARQEIDQDATIDSVKSWLQNYYDWKRTQKQSSLSKVAKIIFQNIFFSTPEEATSYQEQMKKLNPSTSADVNTSIPKLDKSLQPGIADLPSNDSSGDELSPSMSYEEFEKDKADEQKYLTKRIEREVKDQVESALEQKVATTFSKNDEELVHAMRGVGRTWEEISDYMIKNLKYKKEDVAMFLGEFKTSDTTQKTENPLLKDSPPIDEPLQEEITPEAPKPPEELVSPETHEKLLEELDTEIKRQDMKEIAKLDGEICKKADEPLETTPQMPAGGTSDSPLAGADITDQMLEKPNDPPHAIDQDSRAITDDIKPQDHVYVLGDYETGDEGFGGVYVSKYKADGETYAIIDRGSNNLVEVPLRNVKKAFYLGVLNKIADRKKIRVAKLQEELLSLKFELSSVTEQASLLHIESQEKTSALTYDKHKELLPKHTMTRNSPDSYSVVEECETCGARWLFKPDSKFPTPLSPLDTFKQAPVSSKEAAPFEQPIPVTDKPVSPPVDEKTIKFKPMDRAPDNTKDQEVVNPPPELAETMRELNEVTARIDEMNKAVKTFIAKIEAEKQKNLREYEQTMQPEKLKAIQEQLTQRIGTLAVAMQNKAIESSEFVYRLIEETKVNPYKLSDKELLEKIYAKFSGAKSFVDSVINGAKSKDTETQETTLYRSPKPKPKKSMLALSRRDIHAGMLDMLSDMYDDMLSAFKLLMEADDMLGSTVENTKVEE